MTKESATLNPTGTGLGLNISNNLAKLLGPEGSTGISVISDYEEGATFYFTLLDKGHTVQEKHEFSDQDIGGSDKIQMPRSITLSAFKEMGTSNKTMSCNCNNILIVDDNEFNIYTLQRLLESIGIKEGTDFTQNGKLAIQKITKA